MKFGWTRGIRGKLNVTGRRIDADAPPLRFETGTPNSESGFIASYLIFPTAGCWEVTAQIGDRVDSKITFVTRVEKIDNGPQWHRLGLYSHDAGIIPKGIIQLPSPINPLGTSKVTDPSECS